MPFESDTAANEPTREEVDRLRGPVIVEFGADWCPHCQALAPRLRDALAAHPEIRHIKIADGRGKRLGRSFRVKVWPNLVFMRDGKLMSQHARPSDVELEEGIRSIVSEDR